MSNLPELPRRLGPISVSERASITKAVAAGEADQWAEKLRRFASLYGRRVDKVGRKRFGPESSVHLTWIAETMLANALVHPEKGNAPLDPSSLNSALFAHDATRTSETLGSSLETAVASLKEWLATTSGQQAVVPALGPELLLEAGRWAAEASMAKEPIVLISPNPFSLFSIATLEIALRLELPIKAILLRSFTVDRFREEIVRDGPSLFAKRVWRKLVLRADENADHTEVSMKALLEGLAPSQSDIRKTAKTAGIPIVTAGRFEDAIPRLKEIGPATGLFTGGGLIASPVINCFSRGIINTHMGHLPQYKGMDVVQAPILEGRLIMLA